jgi:hypothetical protein
MHSKCALLHVIYSNCPFRSLLHVIYSNCPFRSLLHVIYSNCPFRSLLHVIYSNCPFRSLLHVIYSNCPFRSLSYWLLRPPVGSPPLPPAGTRAARQSFAPARPQPVLRGPGPAPMVGSAARASPPLKSAANEGMLCIQCVYSV